MNILTLVAGTNTPSNSLTLANEFINGIRTIDGAETELIRLKDLSIEHFNLLHYKEDFVHEEDFIKIMNLIRRADGIVIATPIWNFGVPAHLKNILDRLGSFALDETRSVGTLNGKPFYLIFTGGAPVAAWTGLMKKTTSSVPEAIKYFGGSICSIHFEPRCTIGKGQFGLVVDKRPESLSHMNKEGIQFANLVKQFTKSGKLPVKQNITNKMYWFGRNVINKITN
ncbi:MAG: NAD(P)H-dependent oxidoreductase [Patescibacteria group bacterium]